MYNNNITILWNKRSFAVISGIRARLHAYASNNSSTGSHIIMINHLWLTIKLTLLLALDLTDAITKDEASLTIATLEGVRSAILSHLSTTLPDATLLRRSTDETTIDMLNYNRMEIESILTIGKRRDDDSFHSTIVTSCSFDDSTNTLTINELPTLLHGRQNCGGDPAGVDASSFPGVHMTAVAHSITAFERSISACPMGVGFGGVWPFSGEIDNNGWGGVKTVFGADALHRDSNEEVLNKFIPPNCASLMAAHTNSKRHRNLLGEIPTSADWLAAAGQFGGSFNDHALAAFYRGFELLVQEINDGVVDVSVVRRELLQVGLVLASVSSPQSIVGMETAYHAVIALANRVPSERSPSEHTDYVSALTRLATFVPVITPFNFDDEIFRAKMVADMNDVAALLSSEENLSASASANLDPTTMLSATLFHLSHQGGGGDGDKNVMLQFREMLAKIVPPLPEPQRKSKRKRKREREQGGNRPIRVGFISTLLTDHSIGRIMTPLISRLCEIGRATGEMEVYIIGSDYDEDSSDTVVRFLGPRIHGAYSFPADRSLTSLSSFVEEIDLDVAIYTDIGMDVVTFFMPQFIRAADVVIGWWGHPTTTGLEGEVDYWFGLDSVEAEDAGSACTGTAGALGAADANKAAAAPPVGASW